MNKIVVAAFLGVFAFSANAQDEHAGHAGDVDSVFEDGVIAIETGIPLINGGFLFETEFGELGNPYGTDEPGFVLDDGSFSSGNVLGFEVQSVLNFWDGISWEATGSDSVSLIDKYLLLVITLLVSSLFVSFANQMECEPLFILVF